MNSGLTDLAQDLVDLLDQENALLRRHDLAGATALVERKDALLAELTAACLKEPRSAVAATLSALGRRLHALAAENHDLLRQAIDTQRQVIQLVTRAAAPRTMTRARSGRRLGAGRG